MELHAYDVFMIVVILVATLFGAWKGMAWQLASISALVVSYFVAWRFAPALVPYLPAEAPWNQFLAMLIIYLGTAAGIWIIFGLVSGIIERVKLQEFDQQIGALFGAFKGVVLCVLITFFAVSLSDAARSTILATKSGQWSTNALEVARDVMPPEFLNLVHDHFSRMKSVGEPVGEARVASDSMGFDAESQTVTEGLTAPGVFSTGLDIPFQQLPTTPEAQAAFERGAKEANGLAEALQRELRNANQQTNPPSGSQTIR